MSFMQTKCETYVPKYQPDILDGLYFVNRKVQKTFVMIY